MSFWDNPGESISNTISTIGQTLSNPGAAKPSDVFTAVGDPLGGMVTHTIDTNPTLATANVMAATYFTSAFGGVGGPAIRNAIAMENGTSLQSPSPQVYYQSNPQQYAPSMYAGAMPVPQQYPQQATAAADNNTILDTLQQYAWPIFFGVIVLALIERK